MRVAEGVGLQFPEANEFEGVFLGHVRMTPSQQQGSPPMLQEQTPVHALAGHIVTEMNIPVQDNALLFSASAGTPPSSVNGNIVAKAHIRSVAGGEVRFGENGASPTSVGRFPSAAAREGRPSLQQPPLLWTSEGIGGDGDNDDEGERRRRQDQQTSLKTEESRGSAGNIGRSRDWSSDRRTAAEAGEAASPLPPARRSVSGGGTTAHPLLRDVGPAASSVLDNTNEKKQRWKKKKKKEGGGGSGSGGGGSGSEFASIMAAMRKKTFFRPYMFSKRHRRGKSDASDSVSSSVKPVPLKFVDRSSSAPARDISSSSHHGSGGRGGERGREGGVGEESPHMRRFSHRESSVTSFDDFQHVSPSVSNTNNDATCYATQGLALPRKAAPKGENDDIFCSVEVQIRDGFESVEVANQNDDDGSDGSEEHVLAKVVSPSSPPPLEVVNRIVEKPGSHGTSTKEHVGEAVLRARNRVSAPHGQAQHLRGLLYDITFDCEGTGGGSGEGAAQRARRAGPHRSSSMVGLFRKKEEGCETCSEVDFSSVAFIVSRRCSSIRSLGSLTDSCVDRSVKEDKEGPYANESPRFLPNIDIAADVDDDDSLCYDSDPGELNFLRRRHRDLVGQCHSRNNSCEIGCKTVESSESEDEEDGDSENGVHLLSMGSSFDDESSYDAMVDLKDDDSIKKAVEGARNRKMDVIWHPKVSLCKDKFDEQATPLRCTAWVEMGSSQSREDERPMFRWKANNEPSRGRKRIAALKHNPYSVDIHDIARVSSADEVDRASHPFAWGGKSFVIQTSTNNEFFFEAATARERDDNVNALKLITARYGTKHYLRHDTERMSTIWVANIEDVDCEDVFVPPHPDEIDRANQTKNEVELVMSPDRSHTNRVLKVQQQLYDV